MPLYSNLNNLLWKMFQVPTASYCTLMLVFPFHFTICETGILEEGILLCCNGVTFINLILFCLGMAMEGGMILLRIRICRFRRSSVRSWILQLQMKQFKYSLTHECSMVQIVQMGSVARASTNLSRVICAVLVIVGSKSSHIMNPPRGIRINKSREHILSLSREGFVSWKKVSSLSTRMNAL